MITDRRNFLGLMAAGAMGALCPSQTKKTSQPHPPKNKTTVAAYTCILLHGLFFMQFKNNLLTVATPKFGPHTFGHRPQGSGNVIQQIFPGTTIDWTNVGLKDNSCSNKKFPTSILQFSRDKTGTGDLLPPGNKEFHFQLTLNRPMEIHPFRHAAKLEHFDKVTIPKGPKGNHKAHIKDNVIESCGPAPTNPISLLVGLVYERDASCTLPGVVNFYAEHKMNCDQINSARVNPALVAAQKLFASPSDFDLEFKDVTDIHRACPDDIGTYGVLENDELSACELIPGRCGRGPNPINCAQFGVND